MNWQQIDIDTARKRESPMLLYLYNPRDMKLSTAAKEARVFSSPDVKRALARFTPVRLPASTTKWPAKYTAHAHNGVALLIMTCDGNPVTVFTSLPEPVKDGKGRQAFPDLCTAANKALKANAKVVAVARKVNQPTEQAVFSLLDRTPKITTNGKKTDGKITSAPVDEDE